MMNIKIQSFTVLHPVNGGPDTVVVTIFGNNSAVNLETKTPDGLLYLKEVFGIELPENDARVSIFDVAKNGIMTERKKKEVSVRILWSRFGFKYEVGDGLFFEFEVTSDNWSVSSINNGQCIHYLERRLDTLHDKSKCPVSWIPIEVWDRFLLDMADHHRL